MIQAVFKIKGGKEYRASGDVTHRQETTIRGHAKQLPGGVSKGDVVREIQAWAASADHKGEYSWKDLVRGVVQHLGKPAPASSSAPTPPVTSTSPSTPASSSTGVPNPNPWILVSPKSKRTKASSPGGTVYRQLSPAGKYKEKSRREAAGYRNPSHSHRNMLPHFQAAAVSPIPAKAKKSGVELRKHLMAPDRRLKGTSPGRTRTTVFQGHKQAVLGHEPSASTDFNQGGHKRDRSDNLKHNRQTSTYHAVEYRPWSDASGSKEPRYDSPAPHKGSHPSYWNRKAPDFKGGPWPSWEKDK